MSRSLPPFRSLHSHFVLRVFRKKKKKTISSTKTIIFYGWQRILSILILFFDGIVRGILHPEVDPTKTKIRRGVAYAGQVCNGCVAYYTYTRTSRLPECRGDGWGGEGGFVMGDGVGAGTPLLARARLCVCVCVYAFTCYVANDLCIPLITSMHCTVLSGDHSFIRPTCALRYCQRQKHRRRTIRAGCVKCATFTDCPID